jgi:hypothetical protein
MTNGDLTMRRQGSDRIGPRNLRRGRGRGSRKYRTVGLSRDQRDEVSSIRDPHIRMRRWNRALARINQKPHTDQELIEPWPNLS